MYDSDGYTPRQKLDLIHARRALFELNILQGKYVEKLEVEKLLAEAGTTLKQDLLGIPQTVSAQCVRKNAQEISEIIGGKIKEALRNLARRFDPK